MGISVDSVFFRLVNISITISSFRYWANQRVFRIVQNSLLEMNLGYKSEIFEQSTGHSQAGSEVASYWSTLEE